MSFDDITPGSVIRFQYLWSREQLRGEAEGRKFRETVVASRFEHESVEYLALLAITSKPPDDDTAAYELPRLEVQRLARDGNTRLWVIVSEWNVDVVKGSFYLEPNCKIGQLSAAVYRELYKAFLKALPTASRVNRKD